MLVTYVFIRDTTKGIRLNVYKHHINMCLTFRWLSDRTRHVSLFLSGPQGPHGALPGASVRHRGPELPAPDVGGRLPA